MERGRRSGQARRLRHDLAQRRPAVTRCVNGPSLRPSNPRVDPRSRLPADKWPARAETSTEYGHARHARGLMAIQFISPKGKAAHIVHTRLACPQKAREPVLYEERRRGSSRRRAATASTRVPRHAKNPQRHFLAARGNADGPQRRNSSDAMSDFLFTLYFFLIFFVFYLDGPHV